MIVHGRQRHPQSQGLLERGNRTVEAKLACKFSETGEVYGQNGYQAFNVSNKYTCHSLTSVITIVNQVITVYYIIISTDQLHTSIQETTGATPYELVYGQAPQNSQNIQSSAGTINEEDVQDIIEASSGMYNSIISQMKPIS